MRLIAVLFSLLTCVSCDRREDTGFDADVAMGYIQTQLDFGPRIPGSPGHRKAGDWIVQQMRARADTVVVQSWIHVTQSGDSLPLRNIFAQLRPGASERILYLAHWDTRPISDESFDPVQRQRPVPGANDGASGVALLMAVADALKKTPPSVGVDMLFVDGEDYGDFGVGKDVLLGSRYFAQHLPSPSYRPLFGVLWDMIGDADLQILQEPYSMQRAPEVVARVWQAAEELGYAKYFLPRGGSRPVTDDHIPLLDVGLRVIDVIDIDYQYHHTPLDTFDKVSAKSMQIVGDVAVTLLK